MLLVLFHQFAKFAFQRVAWLGKPTLSPLPAWAGPPGRLNLPFVFSDDFTILGEFQPRPAARGRGGILNVQPSNGGMQPILRQAAIFSLSCGALPASSKGQVDLSDAIAGVFGRSERKTMPIPPAPSGPESEDRMTGQLQIPRLFQTPGCSAIE